MFTNNSIIQSEKGYSLFAGTFFSGIHTNPLSRFRGEAQPCFIYKDGIVKHVVLKARTTSNNELFIDFGDIKPIPVAELKLSLKDQALSKVLLLKKVFDAIDKDLPLYSGIVPLYAIYFFDEDGVIILSDQLCEAISSCNEDDFNQENTFYLSWVEFNPEIKRDEQLVQLLYFAQTGILPFASFDIRNTKASNFFKLKNTSIEPRIANAIDKALLLKGPRAELDFNKEFSSLNWSTIENPLDTEVTLKAQQKLNQRATNTLFLKKKGWLIGLIAFIIFVASFFIINYLKSEFGPPKFASMDSKEIITRYYEAVNDLDTELLEDSFTRKLKPNIYNEIVGLYVNRQTRMAYESTNYVITPKQWLESNKPDLLQSAIIYGVADVSLKEVGQNTIEATTILYSPYDYFDEEVADLDYDAQTAKSVEIYVYKQVERFDFEQRKTWLEIINQETISLELIDVLNINYVPKQRTI